MKVCKDSLLKIVRILVVTVTDVAEWGVDPNYIQYIKKKTMCKQFPSVGDNNNRENKCVFRTPSKHHPPQKKIKLFHSRTSVLFSSCDCFVMPGRKNAPRHDGHGPDLLTHRWGVDPLYMLNYTVMEPPSLLDTWMQIPGYTQNTTVMNIR